MPDSQAELIEQILDDVLANDAEIRDGAKAARIELEDLRDVVLRRQEEVWEACLAEQNVVEAVEAERSRLSSKRSRYRMRFRGGFVRFSTFYLPLSSIAAGIILILLGYFTKWPGWFVIRNPRFAGIALLGAGIFILAEIDVLRLVLKRRFERSVDAQLREVDSRLTAANESFEQALRDKGIRGTLREIINVQDPSYSHTFQVQKAAGLAELRDPLYEIRTKAQKRIQELLTTMPGGSIGVSGPRGVGKTTLLRYFCSPRFTRPPTSGLPDLRVLISAPVQYDARDFVLYLFSAICQAVLGPEEAAETIHRGWQSRPNRPESPFFDFARLLVVPLAILLPLYGLFLLVAVMRDWTLNPSLAPGILFLVVGITGLEQIRRIISKRGGYVEVGGIQVELDEIASSDGSGGSRDASEQLRDTARHLLLGLTYQQTIARGWTGAVKLPVGLEGGLSSTTTMMNRPMSYPEVVARLGDFLKQASVSRRVLIGIDEMDKIESDDLANQFLNDLKAIFGLDNCFWLVSVSQNAMSAFERRGLPFRDVFDSAFDVIVEVDYLDLAASKQLLNRRAIGMSVPFLCLCYCLSGGLPRDLIRVARELLELSRAAQSSKELTDLTRALVANDLDRKRRAVAIAASGIGLEPHTGQFLDMVEGTQAATTPETLLTASRTLIKDPQDDSNDPSDKAAEARFKLARLRLELATYHYYCATLTQFFNADLTEKYLKAAEEAADDSSIDQLAQARQAFAVSPQVAWSANSTYRNASGMDTLSFMGDVSEPPARVTPHGAGQPATTSAIPSVSG